MSRTISQTETVTWTQGSGREIRVDQHLVAERTDHHYCDGHEMDITKAVCEIVTEVYVGGEMVSGSWVQSLSKPVAVGNKTVTAQIAYKGRESIGVLAEDHERIKAARSRLEATAEYQAELERERKADETDRLHRESYRMIDEAR